MNSVMLSDERVAELAAAVPLASIPLHETTCPVDCQACHDENVRDGITELLTERAALLEHLSEVEHDRDSESVALVQWQDAHGSLEHAFDTLIEALGCESNVASALAVIDTLKTERDAYREALMQIAIDPEPDTRDDMTDFALNVLTEHAPAEMITARVEQAEAAFAARSAEA